MKQRCLFVTILYILITLCACGSSSDLPGISGSSSDGNTQASLEGAIAELDLEPSTIKLGNKTVATIYLSEISEDGVLLKVRFPSNLQYEPNSSFIFVDGDAVSIDPALGPLQGKANKFVIYLLTRDSFDSSSSGRVQVQFRAVAVNSEDEQLEIDLQKHEPGEDPEDEFDVDKPLFSAEASENLLVIR